MSHTSLEPKPQGRMLLSHNFNVSPDLVPALNREEFAAVFQSGLEPHDDLHARLIEHPHWSIEILFSPERYSPRKVGEFCAQVLAHQRIQHLSSGKHLEILILGGLKTTPPTSDAPDALQPGQWGVDVVETLSGKAFLQTIAWETTIAQRPADSIFQVGLNLPELESEPESGRGGEG